MPRNNSIVPLPEPLKQELQQNFENRYKFASGISWEIVWQDWCRELETDPPTPPTVRAILFSDKNACEYRIADGLCQLLSKRSYDDWISQLREDLEKNLSLPEFKAAEEAVELKGNKTEPQALISHSSTSTIKWEIRLEANEELADAIFSLVKQYSGDASLTLRRIAKGSLVLVVEGSPEGFEQIEQLFASGELTNLLGVPVFGVQKVSASDSVNLSRWFQNCFEAGWQAAAELLTPQQLSPVFWGAGVKGAKLIDFRIDLVRHKVILVISLMQENDLQVSVRLQVYPQGEAIYLPSNLQLQVFSEGEVFQEVAARSADQFIQCQFGGALGDCFSVQVALGETSVRENFVI